MKVYEIGVRLAMSGNAHAFLGTVMRDLMGIHGHIGQVQSGLAKMRLAIGGGLAVGAGLGILKLSEHLASAGEPLENMKAQLSAMLPMQERQAVVAQFVAAAYKEAADNNLSNVNTNMATLIHNFAAMGDATKAVSALHDMASVSGAMNAYKGNQSDAQQEKNAYSLSRILEMLGKSNTPQQIHDFSDSMIRGIVGERGNVDFAKLLSTIQNIGASRVTMTPEFMREGLIPLSQIYNQRAGTMLGQLNRSLSAGVGTEMQANALEKYGIFKKEDEFRVNGRFKGMNANSAFENETLRSNPTKWAQDVLAMWKGKGIDINDDAKMTDVVTEIGKNNKNLGSLLAEFFQPDLRAALVKMGARADLISSDEAKKQLGESPNAVEAGLRNQVETAETAISPGFLQSKLALIKAITPIITEFGQWASVNPEKVASIGKAIVAIGAGLVALGTVAIGASVIAMFSPAGWLIAGIVAIGASVALLQGKFELSGRGIADAVEGIGKAILGAVPMIASAAASLGAAIASAIGSLFMDAAKGLVGFSKVAPGDNGLGGFAGAHDGGIGAHLGGGERAPTSSYHGPTAAGAGGKQAMSGPLYLDGKAAGRYAAIIAKHGANIQGPAGHDGGRSLAPIDTSYA